MSIRGETKNVALQLTVAKDATEFETFIPISIERRNGRLTAAGAWQKRPGHKVFYDFGAAQQGYAVIPYSTGLVVFANGDTYSIGSKKKLARMRLAGRPRWATHDNALLIATGYKMREWDGGADLEFTSGSPPDAKYISTLNSYVIASGYHRTEWRWSDEGNHSSWTASNFTNVEDTDQTIREQRVVRDQLLFFLDRSLEVWSNTGGSSTFSRAGTIGVGIGASDSMVAVNDVLMWLGDDGEFYQMEGSTPRPISAPMRRELNALTTQSDCYGMHFAQERCVAWMFPSDTRCFVYDYRKDSWSEDATWQNACWSLPPYGAYGEIARKRYVLDYYPTGRLLERDDDLYDDAGTDIRTTRRYRVRLNDEGKTARVSRALFRAQRVSDALAGHSEGPQFLVRWRIDAGAWHPMRRLSITQQDDPAPYMEIRSLGYGREIEFEITETDAVNWIITDLSLTARQMGR